MPDPSSRLELTWANKGQRLLSHSTDTYEWVDPADWRVSEVRLLHEVGTVGENPADNLLICGDALHALTSLTSLPEYAERYVGKVRLCYIDPPFNTGQTFTHYNDAVEHSVWLTMLRDRLVQVHRLLAPNGSVWVHLDDSEQHRARSVLDEVFGAENFVGTVIWEKTDSPRMDAKRLSVRHDTVHVYQRSSEFRLNQLPGGKSNATKVTDDGRPYYLNPMRARGGQGSTRAARPTLYFPMVAPDGTEVYPKLPDGGDGAWRWSREKVARDAHEIEWVAGKQGWNPYYRIYEEDERTRPPETLWRFTEVGSTRTSANEVKQLFSGSAFSTPKPECLIERIVKIASDPGDIVLDCFAGSGTTAAVAHKMKRRWVTVEVLPETVASFTRPRLELVVEGKDPGGITKTVTEEFVGDLPAGVEAEAVRKVAGWLDDLLEHGTFEGIAVVDEPLVKRMATVMRRAAKVTKKTTTNWSGGGGFTVAEVGPSMFEADGETVFLADWVTGGALADAVCAQVGFERIADEAPFAGRRGRRRLAVIDGMLTAPVAEHLVGLLGERETLLAVAQSLEPGVEDLVRELRSGSRARKVPRDLARVGRTPSRLVRLGTTPDGES